MNDQRGVVARAEGEVKAMRVYADQNVVSALWRWHQRPEENAAILTLKEWHDAGRIRLVVSAVHDRERPLPAQFRERQQAIRAALPEVEFADDTTMYGSNTIYDGVGGFVTYGLFEDDKIARRLREIGLDRLDAHHVMLVIKRECDAFVTCDEATILKYQRQVAAEFPIPLLLPSEFIERYRDTLDPHGPNGRK